MAVVTADKVITVATNEIGYLEKASNSQLSSKTANAGSNNYTKYGSAQGCNGSAWCDAFVDWCFIQAFGKETASKLLGGFSNYTPTSAQYFKNMKRWHTSAPKAGDVIFFKNSERICHTGIVYSVAGNKVYTIEGNTSGASGVIANGGGVCKKSYALNYAKIAGYGRPAYEAEETKTAENKATEKASESNDIAVDSAGSYSKSLAGTYTVTASGLNMRSGAGTDKKVVEVIQNGEKVICYGYHTVTNGTTWLLVKHGNKTGYCSQKYLAK